jgi:hypothetical protein
VDDPCVDLNRKTIWYQALVDSTALKVDDNALSAHQRGSRIHFHRSATHRVQARLRFPTRLDGLKYWLTLVYPVSPISLPIDIQPEIVRRSLHLLSEFQSIDVSTLSFHQAGYCKALIGSNTINGASSSLQA